MRANDYIVHVHHTNLITDFFEVEKSNKLRLQHLEFNFIQAVIYPQRSKNYKSML